MLLNHFFQAKQHYASMKPGNSERIERIKKHTTSSASINQRACHNDDDSKGRLVEMHCQPSETKAPPPF
jgi:hypothetical protein